MGTKNCIYFCEKDFRCVEDLRKKEGCVQCDQMLDQKSFSNSLKSCLNNIHICFYVNWYSSKSPKSQQPFWATFCKLILCQEISKIAQSGHTGCVNELCRMDE